ncbi:MAG: hypothetical protein H6718_23410 [Polyangiaceae bacterium]|nr:hypothetical protein [Polyangiaceae bacterium]
MIRKATLQVGALLALGGFGTLACSSAEDETTASNGGAIVVSASGEELALEGYPFPPQPGVEAFFGDGWEVKFSKVLVVVSDVHVSESPDTSPTDQSKVGKRVASLPGPFAVNLAAPGDLVGKGGGAERAWTLGRLENQNLNGGGAFDASQRYAFGYSLIDASDEVTNLQGFTADDADWAEMKQNHWTHLLVGTATFKGTDCSASKDSYDFNTLPTKVKFRFGFEADVSMENCQNPENTGSAFDGEEFQRGIQVKAGGETTVQATIHTDHLFWDTVDHGAIPLFNQFAAQAKDVGGEFVVTTDDLVGVPLAPVTDSSGAALPWRSCVDASEYTLPSLPSEVTFETEGNDSIADLHDFLVFNASTMGHLNQDGLCYAPGFEHSH